ncbi:MAG TPA: hypothetical protein PLJ38_01365 [bacterium]|nr:hypothetical protein [bacterium]
MLKKNTGIVLPVILIILSSLVIIIFATTVSVSYFNQTIEYEITDAQLTALTESAANLAIEEIKQGINFDNSDTNNFYAGIGKIREREITFIRESKKYTALISCDIIDEIDNSYILECIAEIPELQVNKKIKIDFKIENN